MAELDFDHFIEQYHLTLVEFIKGNPEPVTALLSHRGDVSLAGGFGGVTRGLEQVTKNIKVAASQFREGQISFKTLEKYATQDLGYTVELERYQAKLFGREETDWYFLRVTNIFRREDGAWRLVHRHGDSIPAMLALVRGAPEAVVSIQKAV